MLVLGPESAISEQVEQLERRKLARAVERIEGDTAVENAVAFARYEKGDFGWGVVVPGYNFSLANTDRPLDAAAAAALARGVSRCCASDRPSRPAPQTARGLPPERPYEDDPSQAVYNRVWILGDDEAVSVESQAQLDAITELVPVQGIAP